MEHLSGFQRKLLEDIIKIRTVNPPGNEAAAAEYLARILSDMGFNVHIQPMGDKSRANVIAEYGDASFGPSLAFCGHIDVVAADVSQWSSDPFTLRENDGRLYGRGTVDMKGAISCMVTAAAELIKQGKPLRGKLTLLFVADEEVYSSGSRCFVEKFELPDIVIIGEPTQMNVCTAHRGTTRYHMNIEGKSGHSGIAMNTLNPIYAASGFSLMAREHNIALRGRTHPVLPPPSIAVTMISAGEQSNSIPGVCRVTVDRRTLPGEMVTDIEQEAEMLYSKAIEPDSGYSHKLDVMLHIPGSEAAPGSTLAGDCLKALSEIGINAVIRDFPACCDQYIYIGKGVDCLLVGPGDIGNAHAADEFVEIGQLLQANKFYLHFMRSKLLD